MFDWVPDLVGCRTIILSHFGKEHWTWKSAPSFELCGIPPNDAFTALPISSPSREEAAPSPITEDLGLVGEGTGVSPPAGTMARHSTSMEDIASAARLDQTDKSDN